MTDIYKKATQVLVWLGPEDENSRTSRQWLDSIELLLPTLEVSAKIIRGSPTYHADTRGLLLSSVFHDPGTDPRYTPAVQKFWERPWFTRGWICQEFLLARNVTCLASDSTFTLDELTDLLNVPMAADSTWVSYRCLMWLKLFPFDDPAPRNYLRMMSAIAGEFDTSKYVDRLFGCLGLMEGLDFTPDYNRSIVENFTEFAVTLARDFGSLDFLSLWSANLDHLVSDTPDEIIASNFPSWVPSFTPWPLSAPWRLATGGARQYRSDIAWDAAQGRKHVHIEQKEDAVTTGKLLVRGKIIDHIDTISSTKFARYWDVDEEYLINQVNQVKTDLPALESWTYKDLITFLNIASASGNEPRTSTEDLLKPVGSDPLRNMSGRMESLGVCLSMGRGRRVMRTEKGHLGLAPAIGSKARTDGMCGSAIVVLHGCIVPVFLELVDEERNEWGLVGDCYVEGMMCGAAVDWEVEDADSFVLV